MKSTVQKITEGAKRRDTIGRNKVRIITSGYVKGSDLISIQDATSSDNIEKMTHVIIIENNEPKYLLKFRILEIGNADIFSTVNSTSVDDAGPDIKSEEELEDDKECSR